VNANQTRHKAILVTANIARISTTTVPACKVNLFAQNVTRGQCASVAFRDTMQANSDGTPCTVGAPVTLMTRVLTRALTAHDMILHVRLGMELSTNDLHFTNNYYYNSSMKLNCVALDRE
jgi:hypothetical protein